VTDFDGTIARIDPDPTAAVIEPLARRSLRRLSSVAARQPGRIVIAVLSGRGVADVAARVRVGGLEYHGNHGLEQGWLPRGGRAERIDVRHDPELLAWHETAERIGHRVGAHLDEDWLFVERRGPSVAFHFRQAADPADARDRVVAAVDAAVRDLGIAGGPDGMERFEGRKIVELRPEGAGGKGAAVARLIDRVRPGAVVVLGDDRSDAEAFVVVRAASQAGTVADALAIGIHGAAETPPSLRGRTSRHASSAPSRARSSGRTDGS
jgi:trehalose-phosphatase